MKIKDEISIQCLHECGGANIDKTVSDYHPLNKVEITKLLIYAAKNWDDGVEVSRTQVRLTQGIKGMTCPRPFKGDVAERMNRLDNLFMRKYTEGGNPKLIDELYNIMIGI